MDKPPAVIGVKTRKSDKTSAKKKLDQVQARERLFRDGSAFKPVQRNEIVGIDGVLDQLDIVIHWLKNFKTYQYHNARLEPGILFEGEPGTGKTLVSRYIATQSGAHFIAVRDFPHEGYIDDRDIATLFTLARETRERIDKPIVLFWDEFEGLAGDRGSPDSDKEQEAVVSQMTSELDGMGGKNDGLLLIGCTNYGWKIDQALKRPGRMGIQIEFNAPDERGKQLLIEHYLSNTRTRDPIDTESLSHFFHSDITASGVEEAVMEAWRLAVYREQIKHPKTKTEKLNPAMSQEEMIQTFLDRMIGQRPTFSVLDKESLLRVAIHESGHAIAALVYGMSLKLVTIRPGTGSIGSTYTAPKAHLISTIAESESRLRMASAPLAAEKTSGYGSGMGLSSDTKKAGALAMHIIDQQGQGEESGYFSPQSAYDDRYYSFSPNVSEYMLRKLDEDVNDKLNEALADNDKLFEKLGRQKLLHIAEALVYNETMIGSDFQDLVEAVIGGSVEILHPTRTYSAYHFTALDNDRERV